MKLVPDPEIQEKMDDYEKLANGLAESFAAIQTMLAGQMNKHYGNLNKDPGQSDGAGFTENSGSPETSSTRPGHSQ